MGLFFPDKTVKTEKKYFALTSIHFVIKFSCYSQNKVLKMLVTADGKSSLNIATNSIMINKYKNILFLRKLLPLSVFMYCHK